MVVPSEAFVSHPIDLNAPVSPAEPQSGTPLHRYVAAFNARDAGLMGSIFSNDLQTIHPDEPEIDVFKAKPFLERMQKLWDRGITYKLLRTATQGFANDNGVIWGELIAIQPGKPPLAAEVVIYTVTDGLVSQVCVYKVMHPTHPSYRS